MKINKKYLITFIILFIVEVFIALFVKDTIIRPYVGDILVVILLYVLIKAFIVKEIKLLPIYIFLFATLVEIMQYFKIVEILNLQDNKLMSTLIGTSFDFKDILCYLAGSIIIILWEKFLRKKQQIK